VKGKGELRFGAALSPDNQALFTDALVEELDTLLQTFAARRQALLAARQQRRQQCATGNLPELQTRDTSTPADCDVPPYLGERRVELQVAPVAEQLLPAYASEATTLLVSATPWLTGSGALDAQRELGEILRIQSKAPRTAAPVMFYSPRALDIDEPAVQWHDAAVPAALLDLLLYVRNNRATLHNAGLTLCLHLAEVESPDEAAFWSDVFHHLENTGTVAANDIKVSIGIDTVLASFATPAILDALSGYVVSLATDYFAYLRSFVHTFQHLPQFVLPDRSELTAGSHFLRAQGINAVRCAHRHGVHAIASCAAALPEQADEGSRTMQWLRSEIERAARDGFDGCSVTDPALIDIVKESFDRIMPGQHQQHRLRRDVHITGDDLLQVVKGKITEDGLRENIRLALLGAASSGEPLAASGLHGADATRSSVEFAADQLWQWLWLDTGVLDDGRIIDEPLLSAIVQDEAGKLAIAPDALQTAIQRLSGHLAQRDLTGHFLSERR
jgi:malate synthase